MATEKAIPLFIDTVAREKADNAMPKTGGQFTGTVEQYWEDTSVACIRGNSVLDGAWQPVSTCDITFIRK